MKPSRFSLFVQGAISGAKRGAFYLSLVFAVLWGGMVIFGLITGVPIEPILINAMFGILISGVIQGAFLGAILGGVQALNELGDEKKVIRFRSWLITGIVLGLILGVLIGAAVSLMIIESGASGQLFQVIMTAIATGITVGGLGGALIGLVSHQLRK